MKSGFTTVALALSFSAVAPLAHAGENDPSSDSGFFLGATVQSAKTELSRGPYSIGETVKSTDFGLRTGYVYATGTPFEIVLEGTLDLPQGEVKRGDVYCEPQDCNGHTLAYQSQESVKWSGSLNLGLGYKLNRDNRLVATVGAVLAETEYAEQDLDNGKFDSEYRRTDYATGYRIAAYWEHQFDDDWAARLGYVYQEIRYEKSEYTGGMNRYENYSMYKGSAIEAGIVHRSQKVFGIF